VLTRRQPVSQLRVGDLLVFARTGAYGWDISHHEFLRHDPPQFLVTGRSPSGGTDLTST
jgi:2-[(L-alanin-3-ylcarbamoyl)methyl]-2-hydroxybutanedioate decarboxylase